MEHSRGPIDVLVNMRAGLFGAFEATPMATVREVFETNTFGVMAMTQAVLPQLRARRSGVVVNVTSSATLAPMPMVAVYTAFAQSIFASMAQGATAVTTEPDVAEAVYRAANDASGQLRFPAGADSVALARWR